MFIKNNGLLTFIICISIGFFNVSVCNADQYVQNLQSIILEDFQLNADGKPKTQWVVVPNRFGREGSVDSGKSLQKLSWVQSWPESIFGKEGEFDDGNGKKSYKNCLALWIAFTRQGYNSVELYPVEEKDGKLYKKVLPFKGRVKQVDLWIWCANYNYNVEMVLMDYRGVEYRLPVGTLNQIGWKNFAVQVPSYIPQQVSYVPGLKVLSLIKLVVWTTPEEKVSGAYIYFDYMKYLADIFEQRFDGSELSDINKVNNLWNTAPKGPDDTNLVP